MKKQFNISQIIKLVFMVLFIASPLISKAETAALVSQPIDLMFVLVCALLVFVLVVLLFILYALKVFVDYTRPATEKKPLFAAVIHKLTDTVPVEEEKYILTDHVYDGIQELDNNLPPWWKYMFYATIVFACVYIYFYHFSDNGQLQIKEYEEELIVAEKEKVEYMKHAANSIDETNVKIADSKGIENGKALFLQNCAACHGSAGEGGVGPNLTDKYWLHGGGVKNIFKTIKYGVPQKGMISWKAQLNPSNIRDVASFIKSIEGTNPSNSKAPQGDLFEEKVELAGK